MKTFWKVLSSIFGIAFIISVCLLDSESPIPFYICALSEIVLLIALLINHKEWN